MLKKILCAFLLLPTFAFSHSEPTGKSLVKMFWNDVKERRIHKIDSYMSSDFQVLYTDGVMTKKQELRTLATFPITSFTLSHMYTTKTDRRIVVSYIIKILNGSTSTFYREIRTWLKREDTWKLVSATFISLNPT